MAERVNYIRLAWAGGTHEFNLRPTEPTFDPLKRSLTYLIEAQITAADSMPPPELHDRERAIYARLARGVWGAMDVYQTILVAICKGGDFIPKRARPGSGDNPWGAPMAMLSEHVIDRPLAASVPLAQAILAAAIYGVPEALAEASYTPEQMVAALAEAEA